MATPPVYGRPPRRRTLEELHREDVGEEALRFARWFVQNKFALMEAFLGELERTPLSRDVGALRERFLNAVDHAQQVLLVRMAVTLLLAFSVITAAFGAILSNPSVQDLLPPFLEGSLARMQGLLDTVEAVAASASLLLVVARLACDRYLSLVEVTATFTAMQIAASS